MFDSFTLSGFSLHWSAELRGSHLRMTEEVFIYPDDEDDILVAAPAGGNNHVDPSSNNNNNAMKSWYQRIPHLRMTHGRFYVFLYTLLTIDLLAVAHCALSVATDGPSVQILFGFEFAIMLISAASSIMSYNLHVIDGLMGVLHHLAEGGHHHHPVGGLAEPNANDVDASGNAGPEEEVTNAAQTQQQQRPKSIAAVLLKTLANPWRDQRATFNFVIELQAQAAKFLFYVVFFAIVFTYYGMPINIFREVYVSFQQLRRRLIAFNNYRRLTNNMEKRFESVTDEEELDRLGHTCIICRDQMDLLGGCKKLPGCGHAFHTHCLREWLVQQQTCPTCRADIAANEARMKKEKEKEAAAATAAAEGAPPTAAAEGGEASTNDTTRAQGQVQRPETSDELAEGWTEHTDRNTGKKYYYHKVWSKSSWDRPTKQRFPCLYRVTSEAGVLPFEAFEIPKENPVGVPVHRKGTASRNIPVGKIIVCTSEVTPVKFRLFDSTKAKDDSEKGDFITGHRFFRSPDGWVMDSNVEKMFELTT